MGEFTQSLLKLTEFAFSYSLMGLLALIFGHGINPEELSFAKIDPLLILMGFVATTLSICDPIGAFQRLIIKGPPISGVDNMGDVLKKVRDYITYRTSFTPLYLLSIIYSPKELKKRQDMKKPYFDLEFAEGVYLIGRLKRQAVNTRWITAEVDRITALVYFIIVISVFISANLLYPVFLQKLAQVFQNNESTRLGILMFSSLALSAVIYMFILRIRRLQRKASIVFGYLTAIGAIEEDKEQFKTTCG
jgi:hypothetical protein